MLFRFQNPSTPPSPLPPPPSRPYLEKGDSDAIENNLDFNKLFNRLSDNVVTWDVDGDVSAAYC